MWHIRNAQHHLTQFFLQAFCLILQNLFSVTNGTTATHHLFGLGHLLITAKLTHLFGDVVHLGPQGVALRSNFPQPGIEGYCIVELAQYIGLASAAQGGPNTIKVGTQQSDINHAHEVTCPC